MPGRSDSLHRRAERLHKACELGHFFHGVVVGPRCSRRRRDQFTPGPRDNETRSFFINGFSTHVPVTSTRHCGPPTHDGSGLHSHRPRRWHPSERDSEAMLFCIGRVPNSDTSALKIRTCSRTPGYIDTDDRCARRSEGSLHGDSAGRYMILPRQRTSESDISANDRIRESP